jgi:hypothetical protein
MELEMRSKSKVLTFALGACVILGCSSPAKSPDSAQVIVAKEALRRRWNWNRMVVDDARFVNGRWVINVWRLPKTPGGMATVEVSQDGEVLRMIPGM